MPKSPLTRVVTPIALVFLTIVLLSAAQQGASNGPAVAVEFRALTSAGSPVVDLKAADVILKVDGRERAIRSFDLIQQVSPSAAPSVTGPFATNTLAITNQRDSLLVLDDESIAPGDEKRLVAAIDQYFSALGEGDRVGIVTVQDRGLNVSFTTDRAKVRSVINTMVGRARASESADDAACRTRRVLDALTSVSASLPEGSSPVTVLFFTAGLTPPGTAALSKIGGNSTTATSVCEVQPRDFQNFETVYVASAASIHVVASSLAPSTVLRTGMENLAGVTGNDIVQLGKGGDSDVVRVARESSAWYRVTFMPEAGERNGSVHRVAFQVARPAVDVRAHRQLLIAKPATFVANAQPTAAKDLLRDNKAHRDLEFRAAAYVSQEPGSDKVKLVVLFEPREPGVVIKSAVVGLYDAKGKLTVQGSAEPTNLTRVPATMAILANAGIYRMRVAAVDANGRAGTVDATVDASLVRAGSLQLGGLVLGIAESGSFGGRLTFSAEPVAIGYLEVYGTTPGSALSARVELAGSETGPAIADGTTKIQDAGGGRQVILAGVPIAQLPAGDVVVRLVVSLNGKVVGQALRTLRKSGK